MSYEASYRVIITGESYTKAYYTEIKSDLSLDMHPDISISLLTVNVDNGYSYGDVVISTVFYARPILSSTIIASTTSTISKSNPLNSDITYALESVTLMDLQSTLTSTIKPGLTCSINGSTVITHSLKPHNSVPVPSWVALNSATMELAVVPPVVTSKTVYSFIIESNIGGTLVQKIVTLEVIPKIIP